LSFRLSPLPTFAAPRGVESLSVDDILDLDRLPLGDLKGRAKPKCNVFSSQSINANRLFGFDEITKNSQRAEYILFATITLPRKLRRPACPE
jgi:hypothetical protein